VYSFARGADPDHFDFDFRVYSYDPTRRRNVTDG